MVLKTQPANQPKSHLCTTFCCCGKHKPGSDLKLDVLFLLGGVEVSKQNQSILEIDFKEHDVFIYRLSLDSKDVSARWACRCREAAAAVISAAGGVQSSVCSSSPPQQLPMQWLLSLPTG